MRSWLSSVDIEARLSTALGFAGRAVAPVVACIFSCFRSRDSRYQVLVAPADAMSVENGNELSELFVSDRDQFGALMRDEEERWNLLFEEFDLRELKDEAKFLKACGTIPETPDEIRKASKELIAENGERKSSTFRSWLLNAPIEKLHLENEASESSDSSLGNSPINISVIEGQSDSQKENATTPKTDSCFEASSAANHKSLQRTQKSVRFDLSSHKSMFPISEGISFDDFAEIKSLSSPYPTPLKLSDDMQTPGTVFPGHSSTARIRYQYVHSVPYQVEDRSQLKEVNGEIYSAASVQELEVGGEDVEEE